MAGKGSKPRPFSVDPKTFSNNWDKIFKKSTLEDRMQSEAYLFTVLNKDWYLLAINPWYKILFNPITNTQKKIPLK